jgi:hypothetical protein
MFEEKFEGTASISKNGWTKWEAVQLADKLEVKQEMEKADWECWTQLETQFEQIHGPLLFDTDDDDQDNAHQDERIEQTWNVELLQHAKEMDMLPYSPSPSTQ